ncbi:hypothetical protein BU23DRAFT_157356 [Bimuria novae-zelandiae CBS 107.79]|uniref:Uncharacterized protein n=1 Tax=Bimuria novae-zelandiae CBS 107.79 TaxID=1447943 RepID=A0A6A5V5N4_9PLEO|nr:hypothetical protein BU23DRAFT_157356 [Bimuria novae-zelandiae CBS 107.79]
MSVICFSCGNRASLLRKHARPRSAAHVVPPPSPLIGRQIQDLPAHHPVKHLFSSLSVRIAQLAATRISVLSNDFASILFAYDFSQRKERTSQLCDHVV